MGPRDPKDDGSEDHGTSLWDELIGGNDDCGEGTAENKDAEIYREEDTLPDRDHPPNSEDDY